MLIAAVCSLALFAGLGRAALWEPDEARFAEATRQMLVRGDALTPWFNDQRRFEKPILFYWLQLPFVATFGANEFASRAPAALAATGCVALTYLIGRRLFGTTAAWLAALILATSFRFIAFARQGLTDVPALFFELLALHAFLRLDQGIAGRRAWMAAWIAVGLAALTKGPVAVIPVAVWIAYYLLRRDWLGLQRLRPLSGSLLAGAVAAPWFVYMLAIHGRTFVDVALFTEIVARVRGEAGPSRDLFYYFDVWPADLLPWTPFFLGALGWVIVVRRTLEPSVRRGVLLALVWFAGVVVLFSLPASKLPHYLLPSHPAAALLTGLFIERASRREAPRWLWWTGTGLITTMLLAASVLVWALLRRVSTAGTLPLLAFPALLVVGAASIVTCGWRRGPLAGSAALAITAACAAAYAAMVVVPRLDGLQPVPQLGTRIAAAADRRARVAQYGSVVSAGLVYYARHRVALVTSVDDAVTFLRTPGQAFLVAPIADAKTISALAPETVHQLASSRRLVVRVDRLFGDRSPYEDGLVLLGNGHPDKVSALRTWPSLPSPPSPP